MTKSLLKRLPGIAVWAVSIAAAAVLLLAGAPAGAQELDVLIDGNGEGVYGDPGSGAGGFAEAFGMSPDTLEFTLEVRNYYGKRNKYRISWIDMSGLIATIDGGPSPYTTPNVESGESFFATVQVVIPPGTLPGSFRYVLDVNALKFKVKPSESVTALVRVTATQVGIVHGIVFDDRDHNGVWSAGDAGMSGVTVSEDLTATSAVTNGAGAFELMVPAGTPVRIIEQNPSGYASLSPDTLGPFVLNAGDTADAWFADVPPIRLSPGAALNGLAGGYIDFPHSLNAGTRGPVAFTVSGGGGGVTMLFLDVNGNGTFDGGDRTLDPGDCFMDPQSGVSTINVLLRLFIPVEMQPGEMVSVGIQAVQDIEGTPFTFTAAAHDVAVVVGTAVGRLNLRKETDHAVAAPGDVITYAIEFFNTGTDTIRNIVLLDPVSGFVDVLPDGFGPGLDVEWSLAGQPPAYLTLDPSDGDECEFSPSEKLLRIIFSKNNPFRLLPGERGRISYRVTVK